MDPFLLEVGQKMDSYRSREEIMHVMDELEYVEFDIGWDSKGEEDQLNEGDEEEEDYEDDYWEDALSLRYEKTRSSRRHWS